MKFNFKTLSNINTQRVQRLINEVLEKSNSNLNEYNEDIQYLVLRFKDKENFEKAKIHFEDESGFYPEEINNEFKSFSFIVQDSRDADSTEYYLNNELLETDLEGYYFESEGGESIEENFLYEKEEEDKEKESKNDEEESENDIEDSMSPGDIEVSQDAEADVTGIKGDIQNNLEAALKKAVDLNDEKLINQIKNTLTFFTREHVGNINEIEEDFPIWKRIKN